MDEMMIPYVAHESAMNRAERSQRRLVVIIILLIVLLVGSNLGWMWYESSFETIETTVEQENADGINNYIGNDGDIVNGEPNDYYTP